MNIHDLPPLLCRQQLMFAGVMNQNVDAAPSNNDQGHKKIDNISKKTPFWNLYGPRIIVSKSARREVLARVHDSHQGTGRTKCWSRQNVYWPGISNDIATTVTSCNKCQEHRPSQQREPLRSEPLPNRVFEDVSADFFHYAGRDFLVDVDRLSGLSIVFHFPKGKTASRHTIYPCRRAFVELGASVRFRSHDCLRFS